MNGETVFDTQSIEDGKTASKPSIDPVKINFNFDNWYQELNTDGTGKGQVFSFTTAITKDFTLYAAFVEDESITVFFGDSRGNAFPQKIYTDNTLEPTAYKLGYYDCSGFIALLLEEDTSGFELPSSYAFRDITDSKNLTFRYQTHDWYDYYDELENLTYKTDVYSDYLYLTITGSDYFVMYYIFNQTQFAIIEDYQNNNSFYMFIENDVNSYYIPINTEELDDDVIINDDFIDNYCQNGFALIGITNQQLKDEYLGLSFNGTTPDGQWFYEEIIIKDGQDLNYSVYDIENYDLEIFYRGIKKVDGNIVHEEVMSSAKIALYNSKITEGADSFIDNGIDYYINESNGIKSIYCQIYDGEAYCQYWIYIKNGNFLRAEYYAFDGSDYCFYFIDREGYIYEEESDILLVGNIFPSEQFAYYQKLGLNNVYISCNYV